jgi:hypothetical protein
VNGLKENLSINLTQVKGRAHRYKTPSGKIVGMPSATELRGRPDQWFMGISDEHFDFVILLCETASGQLLDFVFPPDFIKEIWPYLHRDSKSQVKFHVLRDGVNYELKQRDVAPKGIGRFLEGGSRLQ